MAEWGRPKWDLDDTNIEIVWNAPLMSWTLFGAVIRVSIACVVASLGLGAVANWIPASDLRRLLLVTCAIGGVFGSIGGLVRRSTIRKAIAEPLVPVGAPTLRRAVSGYRPRFGHLVLVPGAILYLASTGRGVHLAAALTAFAVMNLADLVGSVAPWIFTASRWQHQTGRVLLAVRTRDRRSGFVATMTTDEIDSIIDGDLGDWSRDWLVSLGASLHDGGRYGDAAALGDHIYARWGEPIDAYNTACSLVRAGDHDLAVEYLGQALRGGYGRRQMVKDPDLAPLLPRPDVMELYKATKPAG